MDKEMMKAVLHGIRSLTFSREFELKAETLRHISREEVRGCLANPERIILAEDQGDEEMGHKYAVLFSKSSRYDLKIVISIKGSNANVITSHVQNIRRRKVFDKWRRMQR